jgi:hypothetical protein
MITYLSSKGIFSYCSPMGILPNPGQLRGVDIDTEVLELVLSGLLI